MTENASTHTSIAVLLRNFQTATGTTDDQLASALGYESATIITMVKDGRMRLPINKVQHFAAAIGLSELTVLRSVLCDSAPELLSVLEAVLPALSWDEDDAKLMRKLRELKKDRKWAPLVFDGQAVIAFMAV